jgi:hypothetical protein
MAKTIGTWLIVCLLHYSCYSVVPQTCLVDVYSSQVGVREATGRNDGKEVEAYLKSCGLGKGYSWCAAFVKWCFTQCGVATPGMNAWSASCQSKNIVYAKGRFRQQPQSADVFTIWSAVKKRIVHTGFFHRKINESFYESVEGNTNDGGSSDGDGVYRRKRSFRATFSITRWIKL